MIVNILGKGRKDDYRDDKFVTFYLEDCRHLNITVYPVMNGKYYGFMFMYKSMLEEFLVKLNNIKEAVICTHIVRDNLENAFSTDNSAFIKLLDLENNIDYIQKQVKEWEELEKKQKEGVDYEKEIKKSND